MASSTPLSPAIAPSQLCSGKNGMCGPSSSCVALSKCDNRGKGKRVNVKCMATSIPADRVPDMEKRKLLNLLLLGAVALPSTGMLLPYTYFFVPPGSGGSGGGTVAKDALGNDVIAAEWLKTHGPGDRTLTQGLKHVPGTLLVNIGDFLEILSNGKYKSVEHRAIVNAQNTRISIGVGHGPQLSSKIGPASPLVDEKEGIQYRPITYKEYIRAQQSSTIRGKSALQVVKTNN